jgi:hypothetical protein
MKKSFNFLLCVSVVFLFVQSSCKKNNTTDDTPTGANNVYTILAFDGKQWTAARFIKK